MLEESKLLKSNISRKKSMALKSLKDNEEIRILEADEGNCMVVQDKISSLLDSGVYVPNWEEATETSYQA